MFLIAHRFYLTIKYKNIVVITREKVNNSFRPLKVINGSVKSEIVRVFKQSHNILIEKYSCNMVKLYKLKVKI